MNIQEKAIEYIPHQEPMVFIDDLSRYLNNLPLPI
jgi:predicted hotdog family 3-hydroxylacyl-ACP dehydratase